MELFGKSATAVLLIVACYCSTTNALQTKVCPGKPADIVLMIDESSSIWPVHFAKLTKFLVSLVDNFDIGEDQTRIAALTYSDKTKLRFGLNDFTTADEVRAAIETIDQQGGGTRTDKALQFARHKLFNDKRDGIPQIVILITDGASWYPKLTEHEAFLLKKHNVTVFTVAISNKIKWEEIKTISSEPVEFHSFTVESYNDLSTTLVEQLVTSTCTVQGNPVGVCTIDFKTDVEFVLASASQNPEGAVEALSMIQAIIADKNTFVGESSLQFGLLPTTCQQDYGFDLNTYKTKEEILLHLEQKKYIPTTADHLDRLVTHAFTKQSGDRPQVRNLAVVIIDRSSDDMIKAIEAANRAKEAGIEIIVVAVGKQVNDEEITLIASEPVSSHKITLSDYSEVADLKHKFYSLVCP